MSAFGAKRLNKGEATPGGSRGGKGLTQGEQPLGGRGSDTEPKCRVDPNDGYPREEPGALAAHVGICAGGEEKSSSLPRPFRRVVFCHATNFACGKPMSNCGTLSAGTASLNKNPWPWCAPYANAASA